MGESFLSWHKPGQKVAVVDGLDWDAFGCTYWGTFEPASWGDDERPPMPDEICTIRDVDFDTIDQTVFFGLVERPVRTVYWADAFRPVYPQAIEALKSMKAPMKVNEVERV